MAWGVRNLIFTQVGELYDCFTARGATVVGFTDQDGYDHYDSKAIRDDKFCGLMCDEQNQMDQSEDRATACAATLGHIFPLWFGFRGGKGAATAGGALLSAVPLAGLLSFLSFLIAKRASGHASVGSLTACIVAPLATWWTHASLPWVAVVLTLVTLVVVRHHSNISRLLRKEEIDA